MSRSAGPGHPHYFRCSQCRLTTNRYEHGRGGFIHHVELTGRRRHDFSPHGGASQRIDNWHVYQYKCRDCGHVGWSRHTQLADRWIREYGAPSLQLNPAQFAVYDAIRPEWRGAPPQATSNTLLALERRGLIEGRMRDPGVILPLALSTYNKAYEWRRKVP